jgi:hypothetical protein
MLVHRNMATTSGGVQPRLEQHRWRFSRTISTQPPASQRRYQRWTQLAEWKAAKGGVVVVAAAGGPAEAGIEAAAGDTEAGAGAAGEDGAVGMLSIIYRALIY